MERPRILFITSWYPSRANVSHGAFVREQAMALSRHHDVRVIAPRLSRLAGPRTGDGSLTSDEPPVLRPFARFILPRRLTWRDAAQAYLRAVQGSVAELAQVGWEPDLVHGHALIPAGWAAWQIGTRLGVPSVVTVHSSFVSQPVLTRSSDKLVRDTMRQTDALIAVSPSVLAELQAIEPTCSPQLIPNLVDDGFFTPADHHRERRPGEPIGIVAIGNLISAKRFDNLLRAVASRCHAGQSAHVTIVGAGPERERLQRLARQLGIAPHVELAGASDRIGVRERLRAADLLVHPSRYETFAVVLIEAMACGVPVIATRSGGPDWVVEAETGLLVDVDDVDALSEAIRRFASGEVRFEPDQVRRRAVDRFGATRVAGLIGELYRRSIIAGDRPAASRMGAA